MAEKTKTWIFVGLSFWLTLNLCQAYFTLLSHDEAYYWMYSRFIDWGYFDHPPAIAVIIKVGYSLFKSELGVRLLTVMLSVATIYLLAQMCNLQKNQVFLFFIIVFSIPLVHAGGFLATPDIPFIFFTTCFFILYKNFLEKDDWLNFLGLSLVMAGLMYSKYHGILVIFFTLLSNIHLLSKKTFWASAIVATLLFFPHLFWQFQHDYPSFKYHLYERSAVPYKIDFTLEYLGGQLLILGPLTGLILMVSAIKLKTTSLFIKALKFNLIGIFIFFLLTSFRSRVEANWTSAAFIPLIILSFHYLRDNIKLKKWLVALAIPSLLLIIGARIVLIMKEVPFVKAKSEFHLWDKWAKEIEQKAQGAPVVFMNSYQKASKYTFYTGKFSHTLNNYMYRKNQFDVWNFEDTLQGKKIFLIPNYPTSMDSFKTSIGEKYNYTFIDNFRSYNKIKIRSLEKDPIHVQSKDSVRLNIELKNTGSYVADFSANPQYPTGICVNFYNRGIYESTQIYPLKTEKIEPDGLFKQEVKFVAPEKGKYNFRIALFTGWLPFGLNSDLIKLEAK